MSTWVQPSVAPAVGLIALGAAVAMRTVGRQHWPRFIVILTITASVGLFGTVVGHWVQNAVNWVLRAGSRLIGSFTGVAISTVLGLAVCGFLAYVVALHMHRRTIDDRTLTAASLLPITAISIPGPVGAVLAAVIFGTANALGWAIAGLFGLN